MDLAHIRDGVSLSKNLTCLMMPLHIGYKLLVLDSVNKNQIASVDVLFERMVKLVWLLPTMACFGVYLLKEAGVNTVKNVIIVVFAMAYFTTLII